MAWGQLKDPPDWTRIEQFAAIARSNLDAA